FGFSVDPRRQHQRALDHDRRKSRRPVAGKETATRRTLGFLTAKTPRRQETRVTIPAKAGIYRAAARWTPTFVGIAMGLVLGALASWRFNFSFRGWPLPAFAGTCFADHDDFVLSLVSVLRMDRLPQAVGRVGHVYMVDAERRERVMYRVCQCRHRAGGAGLARALGTERVVG